MIAATIATKTKIMSPIKTNKLQASITLGQLLGVGFSLLGAIIIFVVTVNVRLSNLENNQSTSNDRFKEFGDKMEKFMDSQNEKGDKLQETLSDIKILLNNKVDKK